VARWQVCAVKAPGFGDRRNAMLQDIATLPAARPSPKTSASAGERPDGRPRSSQEITVDKDNTTLIEGKGKHNEIEGRVKEIRSQVEKTTSDYDREKLQEPAGKADRWRSCDQGWRGDRD